MSVVTSYNTSLGKQCLSSPSLWESHKKHGLEEAPRPPEHSVLTPFSPDLVASPFWMFPAMCPTPLHSWIL